MTKEFKQIYDKKNLTIIFVKLFIIFFVSIIFSIKFFTLILGLSFFLLVALLILIFYYKSTHKIILTSNQITLKKSIGTITLDFKYIGEVEKLNYKHIINLKSNSFSAYFSLFGKDSSYSSKKFKNINMISTSDKFKDNILIEYGIDYYILSISNRDEFYDELNKRLKTGT